MGYSYGFVDGSRQTFDFFIAFAGYSVENGILNMEINTEQLETYLRLAKDYCYRAATASASPGVIECGDGY